MDILSKQRLKDLRSFRMAKRCREEGLFVVEGVKLCDEVLRSDWSVTTICGTAGWMANHPDLPATAACYEIGERELEMLSGMRTPNEVWMLVRRRSLSAASGTASSLTLVLDGIQDPGNMGTMIRTADWFGIRQVVCSHDTVDCYNPKVVQATMGSLLRTEVVYTDLAAWLARFSGSVYGAVLGGTELDTDTVATPAALVIGNEGRGIDEALLPLLTHRVTIANRDGTAESLNAAVAAGILMEKIGAAMPVTDAASNVKQ